MKHKSAVDQLQKYFARSERVNLECTDSNESFNSDSGDYNGDNSSNY